METTRALTHVSQPDDRRGGGRLVQRWLREPLACIDGVASDAAPELIAKLPQPDGPVRIRKDFDHSGFTIVAQALSLATDAELSRSPSVSTRHSLANRWQQRIAMSAQRRIGRRRRLRSAALQSKAERLLPDLSGAGAG